MSFDDYETNNCRKWTESHGVMDKRDTHKSAFVREETQFDTG